MKKENSFLSWCWKGSCHDARFSIGDGDIGNCKKKIYNRNDVFDATEFRTSLLKVKEKKICAFSFPKAITKASVSKIKPQSDQ